MSKSVKGLFFKDYVRMIKSRKDVDWSRHLSSDDMSYLSGRIEDSEWYPFESFERMGLGILEEIAGGSMDMVRVFGRTYLDRLFSLHSSLISKNDPHESLIRFQVIRKSFFEFDPITILVFRHNFAKIEIAYGMSPKAEEAATFQTLGYFERLLELSGAKSVWHRFTSRKWEGAESTILELDWSEVPDGSQVKGVLLVDYVRMIKSAKEVDWSKHLTQEDLALLEERIEEDRWYPFDALERMTVGIFREIAFNDMEKVREWGQRSMDQVLKMHPDLVSEDDPAESLVRVHVLRKSFFSFEPVEVSSLASDSATVTIRYGMCAVAEEAATWQFAGFFQKLLELAGARDVKVEFATKAWEGDSSTLLHLGWS